MNTLTGAFMLWTRRGTLLDDLDKLAQQQVYPSHPLSIIIHLYQRMSSTTPSPICFAHFVCTEEFTEDIHEQFEEAIQDILRTGAFVREEYSRG